MASARRSDRRYLRKNKHPEPIIEVEILKRHSMPLDYLDINRQPVPMLPLERRTGVTEVEVGYDAPEAMPKRNAACTAGQHDFEARRKTEHVHSVRRLCRCGPEKCLELVALDRIAFEPETCSIFATTKNVLEWNSTSGSDELGIVTGAAMLKDETRCIRCGLCAIAAP